MAFLDNSKDIILDAVLTDLGRRRLAEGRFNIVRFSLGDDEINYGLFDKNAASTVADLEILKTPVFEAFTNNVSSMNSKLVSYPSDQLLYLPVFRLNTSGSNLSTPTSVAGETVRCGIGKTDLTGYENVFLVSVDNYTTVDLTSKGKRFLDGSSANPNQYIRIDQGVDNIAMPNTSLIDQSMLEEDYMVEIDNKFAYLTYNGFKVNPTFVDDADIANYTFSRINTSVQNVKVLSVSIPSTPATQTNYAIAGARGTCLSFGILASEQLQNNTNYWFTTVGSQVTIDNASYYIINTTVTITGMKTGYSLDVPVSFIKKVLS